MQLRKSLENEMSMKMRKIEDTTNKNTTANKTIKLNLNYRFLYHELYEILKEKDLYGPKEYEKYRAEARRLDEQIHFPFYLFAPFY
jgi:hypothetical protein